MFKIKYIKFGLFILGLLIFTACGGNNTTKQTEHVITDKLGSFIFIVKDTQSFRINTSIKEYEYNYSVDWGDNNYDNNVTESIDHEYAEKGTYTIKIKGKFPKLNECYSVPMVPITYISSIEQWGNIEWKDMSSMFYKCPNIAIHATDIPNLKSVKNMSGMFKNVKNFNQDISYWDVSNVKYMGEMFHNASKFNQDISHWDVSNVKDMGAMFLNAEKFNQNLSHWNITSVVYKESQHHAPGIASFFGLEMMFYGVTLSTENYDAILQSWSQQAVHNNIYFDGGNSKYSQSSIGAREKLINEYQWRITDGGMQ